jgi:hypothetical protein
MGFRYIGERDHDAGGSEARGAPPRAGWLATG